MNVVFTTDEGRDMKTKPKADPVKSTLLSAARLNEGGVDVELNSHHRLANPKTGKVVPMNKGSNTYILAMWVRTDQERLEG